MEYYFQIWFYLGQIASWRWKGHFQKPLGRRNFVDEFSTGFSLITRERCVLQTWNLAQKIRHAILRRMVYSESGNKLYLKSQFGEIGRFSCILGFFRDFHDFVAAKRWAGLIELACKASDFRHQMALFNFHQYSNRFYSFHFNYSLIYIFAYLIFFWIDYLNFINFVFLCTNLFEKCYCYLLGV